MRLFGAVNVNVCIEIREQEKKKTYVCIYTHVYMYDTHISILPTLRTLTPSVKSRIRIGPLLQLYPFLTFLFLCQLKYDRGFNFQKALDTLKAAQAAQDPEEMDENLPDGFYR